MQNEIKTDTLTESLKQELPTAVKSASGTPWYLWCSISAVTSGMIGARWDVSWHESIGRDTFWTPAHMAIYLCSVLAGVVCGYLILNTTLRSPQQFVPRSVHVLGFRAPLGAFLAAWGGVAMLTSAPFDNWWHSAYGLDVKIISPPHALLMLGSVAIETGTLLLTLAEMNRAATSQCRTRQLQWLLIYLFGILLLAVTFFCSEYTRDVLLHSPLSYLVLSVGVPFCFALAWKASRHRWAMTAIAGIYTIVTMGFILILPLFPAQPKLGPVYQPVTHFVPPQFPLLLLVPAVFLDLLFWRIGNRDRWLIALAGATVFLLSLLAVEWPFADFLMTTAAQNPFFATGYHAYFVPPWSAGVTRQFIRVAHGVRFQGFGLAMFCAVISMWLGLKLGDWMRKVQR
ncbi:hypothetical protein [Occallatibacter riparius]|uniref:Uncharacterized protein n=1 Tax=Occallatibacter riparius TaxID=1002689 RepID=A0A9J7BK49_9BACT|nr:hypothetical protein [Occallatibacter riparius]UWZ82825.1 hypothetical protein MOP44_19925 [Occallatibacter riparius]